jgi:hypothetical protein
MGVDNDLCGVPQDDVSILTGITAMAYSHDHREPGELDNASYELKKPSEKVKLKPSGAASAGLS